MDNGLSQYVHYTTQDGKKYTEHKSTFYMTYFKPTNQKQAECIFKGIPETGPFTVEAKREKCKAIYYNGENWAEVIKFLREHKPAMDYGLTWNVENKDHPVIYAANIMLRLDPGYCVVVDAAKEVKYMSKAKFDLDWRIV
jgi:hypothetical protein